MALYSELIFLICPNCDEKLDIEACHEIRVTFDGKTGDKHLTCPVCCVQNHEKLFEQRLDIDE